MTFLLFIPAFVLAPQDPELPDPPLPAFLALPELKIADGDSELVKLKKERANVAMTEAGARFNQFRVGRGTLDELLDSLQRTLNTRLEFVEAANRLDVLSAYVELCWLIADLNQQRYDVGAIKHQDVEQPYAFLADAEIQLLQAGGRLNRPIKEPGKSAIDETDSAQPKWPAFVTSSEFRPDPKDSDVKKLEKRRAACTARELQLRYSEFLSGRGTFTTMLDSAHRSLDYRLALITDKDRRIKELEDYLNFLRGVEKTTKARFDNGAIQDAWLQLAIYQCTNAELKLAREGQPPPPAVPPLPAGKRNNAKETDEVSQKAAEEFVNAPEYRIAASDPAIEKLLKARANAVGKELKLRYAEAGVGRGDFYEMMRSANRALESRLEWTGDPEQRRNLYWQHRECFRTIDGWLRRRNGCWNAEFVLAVIGARLDAEIRYLQGA